MRTLLPRAVVSPRSFTLVTGEMAAALVQNFADTMNCIDGMTVNTCVVHNHFFEGNISVAGLLTGNDIANALTAPSFSLHDTVIIPSVALRDGEDRFLDDLTITELGQRVNRRVLAVERMPSSAAAAMLN